MTGPHQQQQDVRAPGNLLIRLQQRLSNTADQKDDNAGRHQQQHETDRDDAYECISGDQFSHFSHFSLSLDFGSPQVLDLKFF